MDNTVKNTDLFQSLRDEITAIKKENSSQQSIVINNIINQDSINSNFIK